jgi:hypothetical protein
MLAYLPLFHTEEMLETNIGKGLLVFIVLFWIFRIFVLQPVFSTFQSTPVLVSLAIFFTGMLFFAIPLVKVLFIRSHLKNTLKV